MESSIFKTLESVNVQDKVENKNGMTYLSWAWAWGELKKRYPSATYTVYENADGWNYFTDGRTCWVKTGVTVDGLEHIEYLPVMDFKNQSISAAKVTSFDVNKAIQRSLTKAIARHGLGLYIYAGEDLPASAKEAEATERERVKRESEDLKEACAAWAAHYAVDLGEAQHHAKQFPQWDTKEYGYIASQMLAEINQAMTA